MRWCIRTSAAGFWIGFQTDLAPHAVVEQNPLMEGKQMVMLFAPKKK